MRLKLLFILSFLGLQISAQHFEAKINPDSLQKYIPVGYELLDSISGDLNHDEFPDFLLIIKRKDEEKKSDVIDNPVDRPLLLYLGNKDGYFYLKEYNRKAVLCYSCGGVWGDPYGGIAIKNGYFTIEHYGGSNWRWTRYITFKYSDKGLTWYLHKDGGDSYHTSDPENIETEIKTVKNFGIVEFKDFKY